MCKIMIIPGINKDNRSNVKKFINKAVSNLCIAPDNDGFGYAAIRADGTIYGEKWLRTSQAFKHRGKTEKPKKKLADYEDFLQNITEETRGVMGDYKGYGDLPPANKVFDDAVAVILHARNSTVGESNIDNTHPFFEIDDKKNFSDVALIHNGTIRNHEEFAEKKYSSCDSEILLHEYIKRNICYDPKKIKEFTPDIIGEYAVAVLSSVYDKKQKVIPYIDLFKGHKDLTMAWIEEMGTPVLTTKQTTLDMTCRECNYTLAMKGQVHDGKMVRFNAITGKAMQEHIEFKVGENRPKQFNHSRVNGYVHGQTREKSNVMTLENKSKNKKQDTSEHENIDKTFKHVNGFTPIEQAPSLSENTQRMSDHVRKKTQSYHAFRLINEALEEREKAHVS